MIFSFSVIELIAAGELANTASLTNKQASAKRGQNEAAFMITRRGAIY
jgi:hypothetical protein